MPNSAKYLLIGSTEAYNGKSATLLGLSHQLQQKGLNIAYGKPLVNCLGESQAAVLEEGQFVAQSLKLSQKQLLPTLLTLDEATIQKRLKLEDKTDYRQSLTQYTQMSDQEELVLLEGSSTLEEGRLFDMSLLQMAEKLDAFILLVARYKSVLSVETVLSAKQHLGERLTGVLLNDIPVEELQAVDKDMRPFLEQQGIPVLGLLPENSLLRSVSVEQIVNQLHAEVLCRPDRLNLMVESLAIGAMNVNSAMKYFRQRRNMAVVTGGDRVEIQLAALESSTHCLILTGQLPPPSFILSKAEDLEIPILSVDLDTLTTVEIVDRAFGKVRLHEPIKVECIRQLMAKHFDVDRLLSKLGLVAAVPSP